MATLPTAPSNKMIVHITYLYHPANHIERNINRNNTPTRLWWRSSAAIGSQTPVLDLIEIAIDSERAGWCNGTPI